MGLKDVFKKIWHGIQASEPYLNLASKFVPPPFGLILQTADYVINKAEEDFSQPGSGIQKAQQFTTDMLKQIEAVTHKNVDNPETRALLALLAEKAVKVKNLATDLESLQQDYNDVADQLQKAIASVKEPAKDDTQPQP